MKNNIYKIMICIKGKSYDVYGKRKLELNKARHYINEFKRVHVNRNYLIVNMTNGEVEGMY